MSKTPKTDALELELREHTPYHANYRWRKHARELEIALCDALNRVAGFRMLLAVKSSGCTVMHASPVLTAFPTSKALHALRSLDPVAFESVATDHLIALVEALEFSTHQLKLYASPSDAASQEMVNQGRAVLSEVVRGLDLAG